MVFIISFSSAPAKADEVANPDLRLCPAYLDGFKPALTTAFFIINATVRSLNFLSSILLLLFIFRKSGPEFISEALIHLL